MSVDRTAEFFQLADTFQVVQDEQVPLVQPFDVNASTSTYQTRTEFSQKAAQIGIGIQKTSQKLQKLTQLAKSTSLFDDPTDQINELTVLVKQDIQTLNYALSDLQQMGGGSKQQSKQSTEHTHTVVDNLRLRLKETTTSFKGVLELRKDNLQKNQERKQIYSSLSTRTQQGQAAMQQHEPSRVPQFMLNGQEQQQLLQQQQDTYLASRNEALQNVESTIHELGSIFQQLATLVQEQGEMAIRIDENMDDTLSNVMNAQTQLLKYLNAISSNRWLVMKIFFVLLLFLIVFVVFLS